MQTGVISVLEKGLFFSPVSGNDKRQCLTSDSLDPWGVNMSPQTDAFEVS